MFQVGKFPDLLKILKVLPIYKKDDDSYLLDKLRFYGINDMAYLLTRVSHRVQFWGPCYF